MCERGREMERKRGKERGREMRGREKESKEDETNVCVWVIHFTVCTFV